MKPIELDRRHLLKTTGAGAITGLVPSTAASDDGDDDTRSSGRDESDTIQKIIRLERPTGAPEAGDVQALRDRAQRAQAELQQFSEGETGIEIQKRFWLCNAALVELDPAAIDPEQLNALNGVDRIHDNYEVELHDQRPDGIGYRVGSAAGSNDTARWSVDDEDVERTNEDEGSGGTETSDAGETVEVTVGPGGELVFDPGRLVISPGTTVRFVWDSNNHNINVQSGPDDGWNGHEDIEDAGFTHEYTFEEEAEYEYICEPHVGSGMDGQISVTEESARTYGLEQINAPDVWDEYGTGSGARVAVLDTGIDASHPDLELAEDGWAEFDLNGDRIDSDPYDSHSHGTHVSGTVGGAADPEGTVPRYGVAPDAELLHGLVIPSGFGSFASIVAGIEWAVEQNADVINMSLGGGTDTDWIEPVRNAREQGTLIVSSSGNSGAGRSSSPANVYDSFSVGATNPDEAVTEFSSGQHMDVESDWSGEVPEDWPDRYVVPDVVAPGDNVFSAVPGGEYDDTFSGTSMASPHVAGLVALQVSATGGGAGIDQMLSAIRSSASKPSDWEEPEDGPDIRYGEGIVDAYHAVNRVALETGIKGTVIDTDGVPIQNATVSVGGEFSVSTDEDGNFVAVAPPGEYELTADAYAHQPGSKTVSVNEGFTTQSIELRDAIEGEIASEPYEAVEAGDSITVTVDAVNIDAITVELDGSYDTDDATLRINDSWNSFGSPFVLADDSGTVTVEVETAEDPTGAFELSLHLQGPGESIWLDVDEITVVEQLRQLGVIDALSEDGEQLVNLLMEQLSEEYYAEMETTEAVVTGEIELDAVVIRSIEADSVASFVETVQSTDIGAVYLDNFAQPPMAIGQYASLDSTNIDQYDRNWGNGDPLYEFTDDHSISDGFDPGAEITLHTSFWGTYSSFEAGDGIDVLADIKDGTGVAGVGLAVRETTTSVFAATLARDPFAIDDQFTDEANELLANIIKYVANGGSPVLPYLNDNNVVDRSGLKDAISDWQSGDLSSSELQSVIDSWSSGKPLSGSA